MSGSKRRLSLPLQSTPKKPKPEGYSGTASVDREDETESHFIIKLGRAADPVRYLVRIYLPKNTENKIKRLTPGMTCSRDILEGLVEMLTPDHIYKKPVQNLVEEGESRIDTERATDKIRNIQFQSEKNTYANVTIDHGGQLCMLGNYEKKLLKYIIFGLTKSFKDRTIYNSRVTIAVKEGKSKLSNWPPSVNGTLELVQTIVDAYGERIGRNREISVPLRGKRASNTRALEAHTEKKKSKEAAGTSFSTLRTRGIESDSMETSRSLEDIGDTKIDKLKTENDHIRVQLAEHFPESDIFGGGSEKYFNESEFADSEDITKIKIGAGDMIDWIQVIYQTREAPKHGGNLGREDELVLEEDERIINVNVTISSDGIGISSLTFYTDNGRQKSFGKVEGTGYEFEMTDGCYLAAIKGFDAYEDGSRRYPGWAGNYQLLPAIGFIQKA